MIKNAKQIISLLNHFHHSDISKYDETFLNNIFKIRMNDIQCFSSEEYINILYQNENERLKLINSLQISYSDFFRNSLSFSVLEHIVLPSLIHNMKGNNKKEIRIWSAACASGQEAYSLAILLEELKNGNKEKFNYRIFATDQSDDIVKEAINGEFKIEALNNLKLKQIKKWFLKKGDIYNTMPALIKKIEYSVFDLFNAELSSPPESIFGDFDIVICANLLFYYKPEFRKIILEKTTNCLAKGGYLITSETEREILMSYNYNEFFPQSAIFCK